MNDATLDQFYEETPAGLWPFARWATWSCFHDDGHEVGCPRKGWRIRWHRRALIEVNQARGTRIGSNFIRELRLINSGSFGVRIGTVPVAESPPAEMQ